ncbi:MAG: glutathione S-transferase family protein [Verrucomicrobiota bacterium]
MIELVQFPWSPFCIVQRRILEFSGAPFQLTTIPSTDRSLVWKLTGERSYTVPILKDGRKVVFETEEDSQVIAKYLDAKLGLGLFPVELEGVQSILWRYIENEIEGTTFRLNDIYFKEFVPKSEQLNHVRHKERKFGRGCIDQWRAQQQQWVERLEHGLVPFEQMLQSQAFLLGEQPRFVDFELFGMLGNFLYTDHYRLSQAQPQLKRWYNRMSDLKFHKRTREKLHS